MAASRAGICGMAGLIGASNSPISGVSILSIVLRASARVCCKSLFLSVLSGAGRPWFLYLDHSDKSLSIPLTSAPLCDIASACSRSNILRCDAM